MREEVLLKFRELMVEPTGLYEVTGYHDVDIAVGNYITQMVDNLRICEANDVNRQIAQFTDRPATDKVIVGKFDDVPQLLRHIRTAAAGRISEHGDKHRNHDQLPVVNLNRDFSIGVGNVDRAIQSRNWDHRVIYSGTGRNPEDVIAICAGQPASLTYTLSVVGADRESTSILCNAIGLQFVELVSTKFTAKTRLATAAFDLDCGFDAVKGWQYSDSSPTAEQDRFYVAQATLTVITEAVIAYNAMAINATVKVFTPMTLDNLYHE